MEHYEPLLVKAEDNHGLGFAAMRLVTEIIQSPGTSHSMWV